VAAIVPVYHRYFTAEEDQGNDRVLSTDLGRRRSARCPAWMSESMGIAQQWGQALEPAIAERVRARLKKEGIEL
jgi:hypothetical protein